MNQTEPFGLPQGSVRGILTLAITGVTLFMWATGVAVPDALLGINALVIGNYFGYRGNAPEPVVIEKVEAPYIPGDVVA
jgi:hypothetical protein